MTFTELRLKHPRLVYKNYHIEQKDGAITITHELLLEPDIVFRPIVTIPVSGGFDEAALAPFAFHLGLIEAISYWKAACPSEFVVEAGELTAEQIRFWHDLFMHGLGEFYYRNKIDFTQKDFLTIHSQAKEQVYQHGNTITSEPTGDLLLVGGGKDSAVTLGIYHDVNRPTRVMVVNPTGAALSNMLAAGVTHPIVVERRIDPLLLDLNKKGYLNGHTPFSAYLAFLGVTVAAIAGRENVVVSNEKSADEGNVMYRGMEVNHQYSKSFRFEQLFREYISTYLVDPRRGEAINYFSFLRPLNDLQIGMMFSRYPQFFPTFRSCNVGSKTDTWCGRCPKCAFTYLSLFPFIPYQEMRAIFGSDYFEVPEIIAYVKELVGLVPVKPFECVGTRDESRLAVLLSVGLYKKQGKEVPEGLLRIFVDLSLGEPEVARLKEAVMMRWGDTYNLPSEHLTLLRVAWRNAMT